MELYNEVLTRYDLREMPYLPEIILKPKEYWPQFDLIIKETNYVNYTEIEQVLQAAVDEQKPAFLFVTGKDGAGRRGVAHHILNRYIELRGIDPNRFLLPKAKINSSPTVVYKSWMSNLRSKMIDRKFRQPYVNNPLDEELSALIEQLRGAIRDITEPADLELDFPSQVQAVAELLDPRDNATPRDVEPHYAAFGVLLEDILEPELVTWGLSIFETTQTIVIFTERNYPNITSGRDDDASNALFTVELTPPNGAVVNAVTSSLWNQATKTEKNPCPFDKEGIEKAFKTRSRSLKVVLWILDRMLRAQVASTDTPETWPANRDLEFKPNQILKLVPIFGEGIDDGN